MGEQNHVSVAWIPGYAEVHGNEVADYLAKSGATYYGLRKNTNVRVS